MFFGAISMSRPWKPEEIRVSWRSLPPTQTPDLYYTQFGGVQGADKKQIQNKKRKTLFFEKNENDAFYTTSSAPLSNLVDWL
jgi:hypothetical protein